MLEPTQHDDETELEEALARPCPPGTSNAVDLTKPPCEQSRFRSIDKIGRCTTRCRSATARRNSCRSSSPAT
jgi:hypothetical protein